MVVELDRDRETGYGFSIRGGRELNLPIFVLRMADGGAAQRDGRLRVRIVGVLVVISYIIFRVVFHHFTDLLGPFV